MRRAGTRVLTIRAGTPADAPACAALMRVAVRALPFGALAAEARAAWGSLPTLYHRWAMGPGGEAYLLAERGARLLGYAAWRGGELTAVFVRPSAQGSGVGAALVETVAPAARAEGRRTLRVDAARPAVGFYRAMGFTARARLRVPLPGGATLAAVRMVRRA